jgi:tRNA(Ile)-lysidine synthase
LLQIVLETIRKHQLLPVGSTVVVGVSGGADSLALLHVLYTLREQMAWRLHVATLDHGLRGEAGAEDARFVVEMCQQWQIAVTAGKVDVAAIARESKQSIELTARRARYHFLTQVAKAVGTDRIAVAHHANDQAETLLMRIVRGTSTRGLQAMAWQAPYWEGVIPVNVVRPLLNVTRQAIEAYCKAQGLQLRHDTTNDDIDYARNYIRHEVLPHLAHLNPQLISALCRLADTMAAEEDFIHQFLRAVVADVTVQEGRIVYPRAHFQQLHVVLQRRFIRWAAAQLGDLQDLSHERILAAVDVATTGHVGAIAELPHALCLRVDYEHIVIERNKAPQTTAVDMRLEQGAALNVPIPSEVEIPHQHWRLNIMLSAEAFNARLAIPEGAQVVLRTRRTGERFAPLGLQGHTQKLSEWMVDHKIPRAIRDYIPLLVVDGQIAAILYGEHWTISHHFAVADDSTRVVYLQKS